MAPRPQANKLTAQQAEELRRRVRGGESMTAVAREYGVSAQTGSMILRNRLHSPDEVVRVRLPRPLVAQLRVAAAAGGVSLEALVARLVEAGASQGR